MVPIAGFFLFRNILAGKFHSKQNVIIHGHHGHAYPETEGGALVQDCLFCKIAAKQIPATIVYQDEQILAFHDINPAAPVHVLVIPRKHVADLTELSPEDEALVGHIMLKLPLIAEQLGIAQDGFRVVINTKDNGGQTVHHLHYHLLGGRFMKWPPG